MATAAAVRPARAADPWSLAEFYQLPEPPQDPVRLPAWLAEVRRANYCSHPVRLAGRLDQADVATGGAARGLRHRPRAGRRAS